MAGLALLNVRRAAALAVNTWLDAGWLHLPVPSIRRREEKFKIGNIFDGVIDENIRNTFAHCNLIENPTSADCWAKYYCGGGVRQTTSTWKAT